jgi:hypothetical protein
MRHSRTVSTTTYILALSRAGVQQRSVRSAAPEELDTVSALYVRFPLDVGLRYVERARASCESRPESMRLQWLRALDLQERQEWVHLYRSSSKELGVIVTEVYMQRDAHWVAPAPFDLAGAGQSNARQQVAPPPGLSSQLAVALKAYNEGRCTAKQCTKVAQKCSVVKPSGRE